MRDSLLKKTAGAALLACAGLAIHSQALAEDWPTKPVVMVVPYSAGGPTDVVARMLAIPMGKSLGQQRQCGGLLGLGQHGACAALLA